MKRTLSTLLVALGLAGCCAGEPVDTESPDAACARIQTQLRVRCGPAAAITCIGLYAPECSGSTQILRNSTDACIAQVHAAGDCQSALDVECTMSCIE